MVHGGHRPMHACCLLTLFFIMADSRVPPRLLAGGTRAVRAAAVKTIRRPVGLPSHLREHKVNVPPSSRYRFSTPLARFAFLSSSSSSRLSPIFSTGSLSASSSSSSSDRAAGEWTTVPLRVYIEDTDAFGVAYYANYAKFFERAVQARAGLWLQQEKKGGGLRTATPTLFSINNMRYKKPAILGQLLNVKSRVVDHDAHSVNEEMVISDADSGDVLNSATVRWGFVDPGSTTCEDDNDGALVCSVVNSPLPSSSMFNTAVEDRQPQADIDMGSDASAAIATVEEQLRVEQRRFGCAVRKTRASVLVEDVDATGFLSPASTLRYFERSRSDLTGGPGAGLRSLHESGISIFVAKIDQMTLGTLGRRPRVGAPLEVRTYTLLKDKPGTMLKMWQELWACERGYSEDAAFDDTAELVATAEVTTMTVDSATSRPTKAPQWLYDRVKQLSSSSQLSAEKESNLRKSNRIGKGEIIELKLWPSHSESLVDNE
eukprot:jgi/Bigna1/78812/fgenesh1_pg.57_\